MKKVVDLGRYLASQRVLRGLKIREVAEMADISTIYISELESGRKIPVRGNALQKLSDIYELDYAEVESLAKETKMRNDFNKMEDVSSDRVAVARSVMNGSIPEDIFESLLRMANKEEDDF